MLIVFSVVSSAAFADQLGDMSLPHAERLIEHMQDFDTDGVTSHLYMEPMIRLGADPDQLKSMAAQSDERLRGSGAQYLRFDLGKPTDSFKGPDGVYTLIPYSCVLALGDRKIEQEAFFVAVTTDNGETWKFMDGIATARISIDVLIPDYAGPPLPNVARRPIE